MGIYVEKSETSTSTMKTAEKVNGGEQLDM